MLYMYTCMLLQHLVPIAGLNIYVVTNIYEPVSLEINSRKIFEIFFINLLTNQVVCDIIKTVKGRSGKQKALKKS